MTLDALIVSKLEAAADVTAIATGGVFHRLAPEGTVPPYVVFFQQSEIPAYTLGKRSSTVYMVVVKAVVEGYDQVPAQTLDAAIDAALTDQLDGIQLDAGVLASCRRANGIDYVEQDDGRYLQHRGGSYRVMVAW